MRNKGLITGDIGNRGNNELSKQSSCFVYEDTKVGSAAECNRDTFTPRRVRPINNSSQADLVSNQP